MLNKTDLNTILKQLAGAYRDVFGDSLDKVILYGSYARGDYDEFSDVDVAGIVHGERPTLQNELKKVWDVSHDIGLEYETILSPTVIPYDEFHYYVEALPFYRNIENEGIVING